MRSRSELRVRALEELESRLLPSQMLAPEPSIVPAPSALSWELPMHAQFAAEAAQGSASVVFLGDSITQNWNNGWNLFHYNLGNQVWNSRIAPYSALNFGVAADQTQNLLWRIENGELAGQPKLAVVMIGTNNLLFGQTPQETADGVAAVLDAIHNASPETKVVLMGILPRGTSASDPQRLEVSETNALISRLADGSQVRFLDIGTMFVQPNGALEPGLYMPDNVHILGPGYEIWAGAIQSTLVDMLGAPAPPAQPPGALSAPHPGSLKAPTAVPTNVPKAVETVSEQATTAILVVIGPGSLPPAMPATTSDNVQPIAVQKSTAHGLTESLAANLTFD